jgi:hypothetical protein
MRRQSGLCALLSSAASALLLAACGPPDFEKRVTEGSYQGFTIGSTGPEAYEVFRLRPERDGYRTVSCGGPDVDGSRIAAAGASYGLWNQWVVRRSPGPDSMNKVLSLWFQQDTLRYANVWGMGRPADLATGLRWDSVLSIVKRVARDSLRDSLDIDLDEKDFDKDYDPCLVDSAFGPWRGDDAKPSDSPPVTGAVVWRLDLKSLNTCGESLSLLFREGLLVEIRHSRYCSQGI